jgi:hypothetical protein
MPNMYRKRTGTHWFIADIDPPAHFKPTIWIPMDVLWYNASIDKLFIREHTVDGCVRWTLSTHIFDHEVDRVGLHLQIRGMDTEPFQDTRYKRDKFSKDLTSGLLI